MKSIVVGIETTYERISKTYMIIKSTPTDYDIRMKVLYSCSNELIPSVEIEDDEDMRVPLVAQLEHSDKFIHLIIETVQHVNETIHENLVSEEHGVKLEYMASPLQVGLRNTPLLKPLQTSNFVSSRVSWNVTLTSNMNT